LILAIAAGMFGAAGRGRSSSFAITAALLGLATMLLYLAASLVATAVMQAATTYAVSDLYLEQPTGISSAYSRVKGKVGRLVNVVLSVGIRVVGGFILFVIPGIIMVMRYSLAVPAAVLENVKTRDALKRSKALSQGSGGRVLTIYVLMLVLVWAVMFGLSYLGLSLLGRVATTGLSGQVWQRVIGFIAGSVASPVLTIAIALLYYDQRVRKEAFDIEHMMSALEPAASSSTAAAAGTTL
jgi:Membrane domain of glycerophosphoryl diester phosphodiesterase